MERKKVGEESRYLSVSKSSFATFKSEIKTASMGSCFESMFLLTTWNSLEAIRVFPWQCIDGIGDTGEIGIFRHGGGCVEV